MEAPNAETSIINHEYEEEVIKNLAYATQLATASVLPMVLKSSVDLNILDIIAGAGAGAMLSPSQIASRLAELNHNCTPNEPLIDRVLRLLASHSILLSSPAPPGKPDGHRLYGLAPVAKYFVKDSQHGASLSPFLQLLQDKDSVNFWYHLKDAMLEGGVPFIMAHKTNVIDYMAKEARFAGVFKSFVKDFNTLFGHEMLKYYKGFSGLKMLVDVGGGDGSLLNLIVSEHRDLQAINFDLPQVIEKAPSYPRIANVGGDMFQKIPKGDAIFIKWVIHLWNDEDCVKILKNCYEALPENGKVIVVDLVIPEAAESSCVHQAMLQTEMYITSINEQSHERTQRQVEALAKMAGFSSVELSLSASSFSLLELFK